MSKKQCKDCKWCVNPGWSAVCSAPKAASATGFGSAVKYCDQHRDIYSDILSSYMFQTCGRRGRWFEQKEEPKK